MIRIGINKKGKLVVDFRYSKELVDIMHELPSRAFNKDTKYWEIPLIDLPILRDALQPYVTRNNIKPQLTDGAREGYIALTQRYKELAELAKLEDFDYKTKGLKKSVKLYPFQKVGAQFLEESKKGLLAMDMGLGKTITSLAAASKLMKDKKVKKPLIICPSTLKFNWAIEIAKFSNYSYNVIGGIAKDRKKQYKNDSDFTIMNYDLLRYDIKEVKKVKWDLIIADEIQRAKNYTTATSKNIRTLHPEYVFGLTGTPIENSIMDLFTIMRFINPDMFGGNGMYFKQRYCHVDGWGKIMEYRDDRHHEVDRKTSYFMMRRKKRDVLQDLPEKTISYHYVTLSDQERRVYQDYKTRPAEKGIDVLAQIVFLREICDSVNLVEPGEEIISSKLDELNSILPELPEDSKVVIFTEYERMAQIIEDNIPYQSVHLHGGVKNDCRLEKEMEKEVKKNNKGIKGKELDLKIHAEKQKAICKSCPYYKDDEACNTRKKIISKFNDDPNVKVFLSTNAGKEGLNLQVANVVINYDMSFNPAVNEQRIARIDRIGQESENILVINMVCLDTIEERMQKTLEDKQDLFNKVIDKTERDTLNRLGVEELTKLM
jgi:SNF2 family DNA or RNA helicase